jgi:hypothetical protein
MSTDPADAGGDPRQLLSGSRALARQVRAEQRAIWFPLLVFATVTFAAIPVDRYGHRVLTCDAVPGGRICSVYSSPAFVYWPIALVLAYVAIAAFSLHRARARGVGTRVLPYVVVGIVVAVLVTGAALWAAHHPTIGALGPWHTWSRSLHQLVGPAAAIGLALVVLAWVERSLALFVVTVSYLVIVLVPVNFGWVMRFPSPWFFLPHLVIYGSVLLLAGIGFALADSVRRPPAP